MTTVSGTQLWIVDDDEEIARWVLWAVRIGVGFLGIAIVGPTLLAMTVAPSVLIFAALAGQMVGLAILYTLGMYIASNPRD